MPIFRSLCRRLPPGRDRRRWLALLLLPMLAACGDDEPALPQQAGLGQCMAELSRRDIDFEIADSPASERGCGIAEAVLVQAAGVPLARPAPMSCGLAVALGDFTQRVAQPAALTHFGQPIARIHHYGTYACRGRSGNAGRLSEHAFGRAIDVSAFELADGTLVPVEGSWRDDGARSQFLQEVGHGACRIFNVVLTPNSNADHHDHFHFDIGPSRLCETRNGPLPVRIAERPDGTLPAPEG